MKGNMDRRDSASDYPILHGLRTRHVNTVFARDPRDLLLDRPRNRGLVRAGKTRSQSRSRTSRRSQTLPAISHRELRQSSWERRRNAASPPTWPTPKRNSNRQPSFPGDRNSRGDRVRSGVSVIKDLEKVDEVRLLLGTELEIAYLPVGLNRRSRLGGRHSGDVLHVFEDLRRRK
jgi:hypothetical protein